MHLSRRRLTTVVIGALTLGLFAGSMFGGVAVASHQFSDVGDGNQFHDDIDWMVDQEIADGFSDGTYRPSQPVSRQAMAAFMRRLNNRYFPHESTANPTANSAFVHTAECPSGQRPMAGGGNVDIANVFVTDSVPTSTGWSMRFETEGNAILDPGQIYVYVLCGPELNIGG
jgi:hypothetical protein